MFDRFEDTDNTIRGEPVLIFNFVGPVSGRKGRVAYLITIPVFVLASSFRVAYNATLSMLDDSVFPFRNGFVDILVILASGIGNSILFGPTLRALRNGRPEARIDAYLYRESFGAPFTGSDLVDDFHIHQGPSTAYQLRTFDYDVSITAFPSNRWQYNLWSWLVGADRRITHRYPVGDWSTLRFLQTETVPADDTLHDVEQNLKLLEPLDLDPPDHPELFFYLDSSHRSFADQFLENHQLRDVHRIGIHPGAGPLAWKRAGEEPFLEELREHQTETSAVLVFGGPEEENVKTRFSERISSELNLKTVIVNGSLNETAALIDTCHVFLSNDTALSHIASAKRVPDLTVFFCGTNPTRTRPWHSGGKIVQLSEPRSAYPFHETSW